MSTTVVITGNKSNLETCLNPPLILDGRYECGLLFFSALNSIPNINEDNNIFSYSNKGMEVEIPKGTYDLQDINDYISKKIKNAKLLLQPNNNTLRISLFCSETVNFQIDNSLGSLLGFPKVQLEANKWHESVNPINIHSASVIGVDCDLINGSYINGTPTHIIYQFVPNVPSGYQFIENPKNIIYFPIIKKYISSIKVKIIDVQDHPLDFRDENIQVGLHIRRIQ